MVKIMQHPDGATKCMTEGKVLERLDMAKVPKTAAGLPFPGDFTYDAETLGGSSGSPVFDGDASDLGLGGGSAAWDFVGIHHHGTSGRNLSPCADCH